MPNTVTYNSLIAACGHHAELWDKAEQLFDRMQEQVSVINMCFILSPPKWIIVVYIFIFRDASLTASPMRLSLVPMRRPDNGFEP